MPLMNSGDKDNPSPRGPEDERAGPSPSEEAVPGDDDEKPIVKQAPATPDANSIDPRVGNR